MAVLMSMRTARQQALPVFETINRLLLNAWAGRFRLPDRYSNRLIVDGVVGGRQLPAPFGLSLMDK